MNANLETVWGSLLTQLAAHRPRQTAVIGDDPPVPVTVLTGFLGAGKTHLLTALLQSPPGGLAIKAIVNDVGSLDFDPTLVDSLGDLRVELTNGCSCCERTADLAATLDEVSASGECDLIVLEASGAADPSALAQVATAAPRTRLDRIVAVVDVRHAREPQAPGPAPELFERQIDVANCVVVSRCDLVDSQAIADARARMATRAPGRTVTPSWFDAPATQVLTPRAPRGAGPCPTGPQLSHDEIVAVTIVPKTQPTVTQVEHAVDAARPELLRMKGRVRLADQSYLLQVTPTTMELSPTDDASPGITIIAATRPSAAALATLFGVDILAG